MLRQDKKTIINCNHETKLRSDQIFKSSCALEHLCNLSERYRKEQCEKLRMALINDHNHLNKISSLGHTKILQDI